RVRRELSTDRVAEQSYLDPGVDVPAMMRQETIQALANMPDLFRKVIVMRDIEGIPAVQVASELGLSIPAVKSRLHRARSWMRLTLGHWMES
ncbi:MAG TPA: sigma factor-like helix-turn-helix DNA-binding protein, partial [Leptospiraceae bacterium]|nr:sigma factor-like helix-turn-helix DNA-binding protein [Leptospiraceae bacterium]